MRPIDADELKKVLIVEYELREGYFGEIIINAIDNTPTVEPIQQDRRIPVDGIMDLDAVIEELKTKAEYNKQLLQWLEELKAYREKAGRDCSTCARYSEFQKEIPEECKGCKHNYFSNYVEKK